MTRKTYLATEHDIDTHLIDPDALFVIEKLREAGFEAYLVGGSVRDLLKQKIPKDFDISTSARPEQVKRIFQRNCLLIGRRFRLAHVRFGPKIIEVATFRSDGSYSDGRRPDSVAYSTPELDAQRRDFTINGLFFEVLERRNYDRYGEANAPARLAAQAMLDRLPESQRAAFVLARFEGLPYEEIAEVLETTVPSVKSLVHRATVAAAS